MNGLRLLILILVAVLAGCATTSQDGKSGKAYVAADTSRTIDLTNPPRDMWDRIRRGFAIPNYQSELTEHWTQYYASRPESVLTMSTRAGKYLYHIVDELERRGLPTELALLPFVESAYNPEAYSRAHASGLWQFIPSTGRHFNLHQDVWRDLRRDPILSTNAALEYLTYLYDFQGDWYLALASYNWGEGAVRRAMEKNERAGLATDYASLKLPDETRNYIPKLQAIKNLIANPRKYGLALPSVQNTPYFTTIKKTQDIDIKVAAQLAEMPVEEFKALNASYNRPTILAAHNPVLLIPTDRVETFQTNLASYQGPLSSWTTYQTKRGESYAAIAKKHGISLNELRAVNGISRNKSTAVAQALLIPAPPAQGHRGPGNLRLASLETSPPAAKTAQPRRQNQKDVVVLRRQPTLRTHTVRGGDTLYALAKRYNTSVTELRRLNNLKGNTLSKGEKLRVPGTDARG
jgi:membrane-bound lytic murein transglycosylase D